MNLAPAGQRCLTFHIIAKQLNSLNHYRHQQVYFCLSLYPELGTLGPPVPFESLHTLPLPRYPYPLPPASQVRPQVCLPPPPPLPPSL